MDLLLALLVVLLVLALLGGSLVAHWIWIVALVLLVVLIFQLVAGRRGV
jgi:hypothetical protein